MPIYEYVCEEHGRFDSFCSLISKRDEPEECPECGKMCERVTCLDQNYAIKGCTYVAPPPARRKLGEERRAHHQRPRQVGMTTPVKPPKHILGSKDE